MAEASLADAEASGIYQIRNLVNGNLYIGSAVCIRKRWHVHRWGFSHGKHPNRHLAAAWLKYGEQAFSFEVVERCCSADLLVREQYWIDLRKPQYNIAPKAGNCLGVKHSEETRRKSSERNKGNKYCLGRKLSDATKRAISESNRGRKGATRPRSAVEASAAAHRGRKRSQETCEKIAAKARGRKSWVRTAEYRAAQSSRLKGIVRTPEHMAALQAGRAAHVVTDQQRAKISEALKNAYESGARTRTKSETHKNRIGMFYAKLTDDQVREIRRLRAEGATGVALAAQFNTPASTVTQICKRTRYRWVA